MNAKLILTILIALLIISTTFCAEYKIIKSDDGRYYLDEQSVLAIANYIAKLEELNNNYRLQISNLEQQVSNLKEQIKIYEQMKQAYENRIDELQKQIAALQAKQTWQWVVVAVVTVGSLVLVFVK